MSTEVPPPDACVVLVPVGGTIEPGCEDALRELERRGHPVWRYRGYSAVDAARNQMATDAIRRGFRELMWVDADVVFEPNDVTTLRAHALPFTCGLYPKKGPRQMACEFLPGTPAVRFGKGGGLTEIRYCGFGFTHVRAEVFEKVQQHFDLPTCNLRFNAPLVPFFEPMVAPDPGGQWSLSEDYAFCERARRAGLRVMADTSIRLWHVGNYRYGWEDAGSSKERYGDYTFHLPGAADQAPAPASVPLPTPGDTRDGPSANAPRWEQVLAPLVGKPIRALQAGVFEGRQTVWLVERVLTHPDAQLTWIDTFAGGTEQSVADRREREGRFRASIERFGDKVSGLVGRSQDLLRGLRGEPFDLVCLDASHEAADALADAVLAWPLLKVGGLLVFDNDNRRVGAEPKRRPTLGVESFLTAMRGRYDEVRRGHPVIIRRTR